MRISHELQAQKEKIKENNEKIKVNKTLPYLVSNVIEVSINYLSYLLIILMMAENFVYNIFILQYI